MLKKKILQKKDHGKVTYVWKACNQGLNFEENFPKLRISLMLSNFYTCDWIPSFLKKGNRTHRPVHTSLNEFMKEKNVRRTQSVCVLLLLCFYKKHLLKDESNLDQEGARMYESLPKHLIQKSCDIFFEENWNVTNEIFWLHFMSMKDG